MNDQYNELLEAAKAVLASWDRGVGRQEMECTRLFSDDTFWVPHASSVESEHMARLRAAIAAAKGEK